MEQLLSEYNMRNSASLTFAIAKAATGEFEFTRDGLPCWYNTIKDGFFDHTERPNVAKIPVNAEDLLSFNWQFRPSLKQEVTISLELLERVLGCRDDIIARKLGFKI